MTPDKVKRFVNQFHTNTDISNGWRGSIIGTLEKAAGSAENRKKVLGYLFSDGKPMSSKQLTPSQWFGLREWIGMQNIGDVWVPRKEFADEVKLILSEKDNKKVYKFEE